MSAVRLARFDDWSRGHWGTLGARQAPAGSWGGKNVVLTRSGAITPVSASRPLTFSNLALGSIIGMHWAWGTDGRVYFVQQKSNGKYQVRRFAIDLTDITASIAITDIGTEINTCQRVPDWFESGGKLYLTIWSEATWEINPDTPSMTALTGTPGDAPGGRSVSVFGERMMIAGVDDARFGTAKGNRIIYSEAADFTNWPTDNFFDCGADPSEIGGIYNMSDMLIIVFSDQKIWYFRGVPGGSSTLRRAYGFHSGAGGTDAFSARDGAVDPSQNRVWLYDHSARCLARFTGTQFARVPGFGVTTVTRAEVGTISGGVLAIGGPDDLFVDQVPMPRTHGDSAAGDNLELLRIGGVMSLVERTVVAGS